MKNLLLKEIRLAMHPTSIIFIGLAAMMIIPNYPYYVTFFYTGLAIFFTCLNGRENNDVFYTLNLPVRKKDIVTARFLYTTLLELVQIAVAIPFAIIRQSFTHVEPNQVGMEANIAFFGLSFIMLGIFNLLFYNIYYKDVTKVGKAFVIPSIVVFVYMGIMEALTHIIPFFKDKLDTYDTQYVPEKLVVLMIGIVCYVVLTLIAYKNSVKHFEKYDL